MGAVPGGAFRTFCDPVYRMSIPTSVETSVSLYEPRKNAMHSQVKWWCRCCSENLAGPFEEERPLSKPPSPPGGGSHTCKQRSGHSAVIEHSYDSQFLLRGPSYLWQSSPMPSSGWRTPVDDSPWARKNTAGRYLDKACDEKLNEAPVNRDLFFAPPEVQLCVT